MFYLLGSVVGCAKASQHERSVTLTYSLAEFFLYCFIYVLGRVKASQLGLLGCVKCMMRYSRTAQLYASCTIGYVKAKLALTRQSLLIQFIIITKSQHDHLVTYYKCFNSIATTQYAPMHRTVLSGVLNLIVIQYRLPVGSG